MQIGTMNNPSADPCQEIENCAALGMDFIDLTLEPPAAASWRMDRRKVRRTLEEARLQVVGHTAYYLPIASPFDQIRRAAVQELLECARIFAELGARWMNVHPDRNTPFHSREYMVRQNLKSFEDLLAGMQPLGIGLMVENIPHAFNSRPQLAELLDPLPDMGLHLDIGHCNLGGTYNTAEEIITHFRSRLVHVHLHDNKGGTADLHMPLGTGSVDVPHHVRILKECGYDGTITLEVFTPDKRHVLYSRDLLRQLWDGTGTLLTSGSLKEEVAGAQA